MRTAIAIIMVIVGLCLMFVTFFFLAAPLGFPPMGEVYADPRVPFAPVLFILGVMLVFLAGVVYELLPERAGN